MSTTFNQETTTKQGTTGTAKQGSIHVFTQKENSLNAEMLWCLGMVLAHDSYNSCCDLSKLFARMLPDSNVAKAFTLGKTKCRITMLYGIAPKFKQKLIFDINSSPFYSINFDKINDRGLVETRYYLSQFLRCPNAENLFKLLNWSHESFGQW